MRSSPRERTVHAMCAATAGLNKWNRFASSVFSDVSSVKKDPLFIRMPCACALVYGQRMRTRCAKAKSTSIRRAISVHSIGSSIKKTFELRTFQVSAHNCKQYPSSSLGTETLKFHMRLRQSATMWNECELSLQTTEKNWSTVRRCVWF